MELRRFIYETQLLLSSHGNAEVFIIDSNDDDNLEQHWCIGSDKHGKIYLGIKSETDKKFMLKDRSLQSLINYVEMYSRSFSDSCSICIEESIGTELGYEHDIIDIRVDKIPASNYEDVVIIQYLPNRC
jgi:hypothetical protein